MKEEKLIKVSLGTVVCLFIIMLIIIGLLGMYLYYNQDNSNRETDKGYGVEIKELEKNEVNNVSDFKSNQNKENEEVSQIEKNETETKKIIPTSDLTTLYYYINDEIANIFYAYIEDGYLYYFNESADVNKISEGTFQFVSGILRYPADKRVKKYEGLNNIKKMTTFNIGTGINPVLFFITETGEVYSMNIYSNFNSSNGINIKIYEGLKDYKIEDILSHNGELYSVFELLLKDGSTKKVTVN